jgi:hypothetical protein
MLSDDRCRSYHGTKRRLHACGASKTNKSACLLLFSPEQTDTNTARKPRGVSQRSVEWGVFDSKRLCRSHAVSMNRYYYTSYGGRYSGTGAHRTIECSVLSAFVRRGLLSEALKRRRLENWRVFQVIMIRIGVREPARGQKLVVIARKGFVLSRLFWGPCFVKSSSLRAVDLTNHL